LEGEEPQRVERSRCRAGMASRWLGQSCKTSRQELGQSWKTGLEAGIDKAGAGGKEVACDWSGRGLEPQRVR
jgi:hypothetical protein